MPDTIFEASLVNIPAGGVLGFLQGDRNFAGIVDSPRMLSFSIAESSQFSVSLTGLNGDLDVLLARDFNDNSIIEPGEELDFSEQEGNSDELIARNLVPGNYLVEIYPYDDGSSSNFDLSFSATPLRISNGVGDRLTNFRDLGKVGGLDKISTQLAAGQNLLYRFNLPESRDFSAFATGVNSGVNFSLIKDLNQNQTIDLGDVLNLTTAIPGKDGLIAYNTLEKGDYFLRLGANNSATPVTLRLELPGSSQTGFELIGSIRANESISDTLLASDRPNPLAPGATYTEYSLTEVVAGQRLTVAVTSTNFDSALQLINATTGALISQNDNASANSKDASISFTVNPDTRYRLRVTSFAPNGVGDFRITTTASSAIVANISASGQTINSSLTTNDLRANGIYRQDYQLTGVNVGQQVQVNLTSTAFDPLLQLVDRLTGRVLAENDDIDPATNRNSALTFTVAANTDYAIRVTSFEDQVTGAFSLSTSSARRVGSSVGSSTISAAAVPQTFLSSLQDNGLKDVIDRRAASGSLDRGGMLDIFNQISKDGIVSGSEFTDLTTIVKEKSAFQIPESVRYLATQVVRGASAGLAADTFQSNLVGKWFLGTVRPDPTYKDTFSGPNGATTTYQYQAAQGNLFGVNGATIGDIKQEPFGNCYFLAALGATFAAQRPPADAIDDNNPFRGRTASTVIPNLITPNLGIDGSFDNTWTVRFFNADTNKAEFVTVDRLLITEDNKIAGSARNQVLNDANNILWVPLLEKAYTQYIGTYNDVMNGGDPGLVQRQLKGGSQVSFNPKKDSQFDFFAIADALSTGKSVTASTPAGKNTIYYANHAYSLTDAYIDSITGEQRIVAYNPHGQDGGGTAGVAGEDKSILITPARLDGFIDASFSDFRKTMEDVAIV